ncbi:MAG: universal stress protein [Comamonas sp.]
MYTRILVPLDGSRYSEEILPYASGLAAVSNAELVLLRVVDRFPPDADPAEYVKRLATAYGARALCLPGFDDVADAILDEAYREPQTLVAMTSRGRSGLLELALGSVAQRVLRGAKSAVLVYHPSGSRDTQRWPRRLQRVILPLASDDPDHGMADEAAQFAHWIGAELEVVSVIEPLSEAVRAQVPESDFAILESGFVHTTAEKLAKAHDVRINWDTLHGDPVEAIVGCVAGQRASILAMHTRRKNALEAAFLGSVTTGCLHRAGVPILMRSPLSRVELLHLSARRRGEA